MSGLLRFLLALSFDPESECERRLSSFSNVMKGTRAVRICFRASFVFCKAIIDASFSNYAIVNSGRNNSLQYLLGAWVISGDWVMSPHITINYQRSIKYVVRVGRVTVNENNRL